MSRLRIKVPNFLVRRIIPETPHVPEIVNRSGAPRIAIRVLFPIQIGPEPDGVIAFYQAHGVAEVISCLGEDAGARRSKILTLYIDGAERVHLRLGQCLLELGNRNVACEHLEQAYMNGGSKLFQNEAPKYLIAAMENVAADAAKEDL